MPTRFSLVVDSGKVVVMPEEGIAVQDVTLSQLVALLNALPKDAVADVLLLPADMPALAVDATNADVLLPSTMPAHTVGGLLALHTVLPDGAVLTPVADLVGYLVDGAAITSAAGLHACLPEHTVFTPVRKLLRSLPDGSLSMPLRDVVSVAESSTPKSVAQVLSLYGRKFAPPNRRMSSSSSSEGNSGKSDSSCEVYSTDRSGHRPFFFKQVDSSEGYSSDGSGRKLLFSTSPPDDDIIGKYTVHEMDPLDVDGTVSCLSLED